MVVGCQPYPPAAFTPGNIPGAHFYRNTVYTRNMVGFWYVIVNILCKSYNKDDDYDDDNNNKIQ